MCGFIGVKSAAKSGNLTIFGSRDLSYIARRGPDENGLLRTDNFEIYHSRLKIIDLSEGGRQPFIRGKKILVYNGEIYNYKELRNELRSDFDFTTDSDTEVLFALIEICGVRAIEKIRGMFAFAFIDTHTGKITLGRDHFGQKPLFYAKDNTGNFYFGSSILQIQNHVRRKNNKFAIDSLNHFQFLIPGTTPYRGVHEVKPGCYVEIGNEINSYPYWLQPETLENYIQTEAKFDTLFETAVQRTLVSDVAIAATCSGGLDSSAIVSQASALGYQLCLFHGEYSGAIEENETQFARSVSEHCNLPMQIVSITCSDYFQSLIKVIESLEFPIAGPGSVGQFLVSKSISESFKVSLSGQGGDELFLGYGKFLPLIWFDMQTQKKLKLGSFTESFRQFMPAIRNFEKRLSLIPESNRKSKIDRVLLVFLRKDEIDLEFFEKFKYELLKYAAQKNVFLNELSELEIYRFIEFHLAMLALLQVEDRLSMFHGVESRLPFLDVDLVEEMFKRAPVSLIENGLKSEFKKYVSAKLPGKVVNRKDKNGFNVPLATWFANANCVNLNARNMGLNLLNEGKPDREWWGRLTLSIYEELLLKTEMTDD